MASETESEKRETLADIVAEIRAYGAQPPPRLMWLEIADRIDAAAKRERDEIEAQALSVGGIVEASRNKPGNAAAMREALIEARQIVAYAAHRRSSFMRAHNGSTKVIIASKTLEKIDAALSAPARQCDVGTDEEQGLRYNAWCRKHFTPDALGGNCSKCPLKDRRGWSCQLAWAQMPYEEGGAE